MDPRLQQETPPVERKTPMRESTKTILLVVAVIIGGVWTGLVLQDGNPIRLLAGGFLLVGIVWMFTIAQKGKDSGTDGHGRKEYDEPDQYRW